METKKCSKCRVEKSLTEFYGNKRATDGLQSSCNKCVRKKVKNWYKNNKDKKKGYLKKWREKNIDKINKHLKKWREKNIDKIKEMEKKWKKDNKKKWREIQKKWRENNKDKIKEYRKKNKDEINKYFRIKRKTDIKFRIDDSISGHIWYALKGKKAGRSWESLVGYTVEDLMKHLESKFESWMSFENYGKINKDKKTWHIDHRIPKSFFKYETAECEEFRKCWALENLQPLEAIENMRKGNKIIYEKQNI